MLCERIKNFSSRPPPGIATKCLKCSVISMSYKPYFTLCKSMWGIRNSVFSCCWKGRNSRLSILATPTNNCRGLQEFRLATLLALLSGQTMENSSQDEPHVTPLATSDDVVKEVLHRMAFPIVIVTTRSENSTHTRAVPTSQRVKNALCVYWKCRMYNAFCCLHL